MACHVITLKIECESWLYKYLSVALGKSPFKITLDHYEGKILVANLRPKERPCDFKPWKKNPDYLVYELTIPWKWTQLGKYTLSPDDINRFLKYYRDRFRKELILWIESRYSMSPFEKKRNGKRVFYIKESVMSFCDKFSINEDDVPYETLKKIVYRYFTQKQKSVVVINT